MFYQREDATFEGYFVKLMQITLIFNMLDRPMALRSQNMKIPNDVFNFYNLNFQKIGSIIFMIVFYILNNIYFSNAENNYILARIYFTILLAFSLTSINQEIKFLRDYIKNGSFIDIWPVNQYYIQKLYKYEEELTVNKRYIILNILKQSHDQNPQFQDGYQQLLEQINQDWQVIMKLLLRTKKSFAVSFSDIQYQCHYKIKSINFFLNLENKEIFFAFKKNQEELNKTFLDLYQQNYFSSCKIKQIQLDYYEDYLIPFLTENYKLLIQSKGYQFDSTYDKERFLELKNSFVGPIFSYYVLSKYTVNNPFFIGVQVLFFDLYD
ncbi:transmembrane protein, putative (macronuclear) [Tetrahymena thermophila SB210]|uniref:Transmembrane protein, putative n=1 Tax=Tetrahymena thermophila (strain SB210) TaxID=312017 RepID=Q234J5_TETTS|nr:transmembrane protein, putative [Tetrahymena thermophila SB210]EAR92008.1 transmembrane protein, putative [Tetrahymena thermophila SB210]|eukprot:XP_001012253.1 transmembrane protein, putative [Tetrahymena thermophila SB210]